MFTGEIDCPWRASERERAESDTLIEANGNGHRPFARSQSVRCIISRESTRRDLLNMMNF